MDYKRMKASYLELDPKDFRLHVLQWAAIYLNIQTMT